MPRLDWDKYDPIIRARVKAGASASTIASELNLNVFTLVNHVNKAMDDVIFPGQHGALSQKVRANGGDWLSALRKSPPPKGGGEAPSALAVSFMELQRHHCRWPLWAHDERPTIDSLFCGRPKVEGSYCEKHARKRYGNKV